MSKAKVAVRDISPILQALRNFLLGRSHTNALRFEPFLADRTQPPPAIPDGVAHKHSQNYYYTRDARRDVVPPIDVTKVLIEASSDKGAPKKAATVAPTPGKLYQWDKHY